MDSTYLMSRKRNVSSEVISYFTNISCTTKEEEMNFKPPGKDKDSEMTNFNHKSSESAFLSKKAHALHRAHQMNEQQNEWFKKTKETTPSQLSSSHQENLPSFTKHKQFKPPEPDVSTSQFTFNINKNCYENIQVQQTSHNPYGPYHEEDFYPHEFQYFQVEDETLAPGPSFRPLGNLYKNIMDFVETTIVQYVCHPSPLRLAAEILARSKLNPNANEFTPTVKNPDVIKTEEGIEEKNNSNSLGNSFEKDSMESIEEEEKTEGKQTMIKITNALQKLFVVEGETLEENPNGSKLMQFNTSDNSTCDSKINCDEYDDDDDCFEDVSDDDSFDDDSDDDSFDDDSDDDSDSDWDNEEQSTGQCVEIDPSEFGDLFPCPLLVTNLRICQTKSSNPELKICPVSQSSAGLSTSSRTISQINIQFFDQDQTTQSCCNKSQKCVNFSDDVDVIEEPDNLAEDLQNARASDFPARQADRERMERLLAPILTKVHRMNIWQKIYGDS